MILRLWHDNLLKGIVNKTHIYEITTSLRFLYIFGGSGQRGLNCLVLSDMAYCEASKPVKHILQVPLSLTKTKFVENVKSIGALMRKLLLFKFYNDMHITCNLEFIFYRPKP